MQMGLFGNGNERLWCAIAYLPRLDRGIQWVRLVAGSRGQAAGSRVFTFFRKRVRK